MNREDHISESEKTHFVSLIDDIIDAMKEYRVNYRQGLLSEYYEALNSDVEIMRTVPEYQEIIAATHQKSLIMEGKNGKIYEYPLSNVSNSKNEKVVNGDVRNWLSDDKSTKVNEGITTFKAQVDLKDDMPKGKYKVYLRISDNNESKGLNGYPVRFANKGKGTSRKKADDKGIWNETLGANYFGSFNVVDIVSIKK